MLLGLFLVPFSQVLLWKNERKAVTFARLLDRAKKACISANSAEPDEGNDHGLVHISGTTFNNINLCDREFGVIAQDSYRLRRTVEMFQWQETFHEAKNGQRAFYTYMKVWSESPIDSNSFKNVGFENPSAHLWPYRSNAMQAEEI
jgi:hypothetical protein